MKCIDQALAKFVIALIKIYQKTLSPDHSAWGKLFPYWGCKFHPTCSMYAIKTLDSKGFFRGIGPVMVRVGKCHPWSDGGIEFPKK